MKDVLHRLFGSRVPEHVGSQRVYLLNVALVERFEGCDITVGALSASEASLGGG